MSQFSLSLLCSFLSLSPSLPTSSFPRPHPSKHSHSLHTPVVTSHLLFLISTKTDFIAPPKAFESRMQLVHISSTSRPQIYLGIVIRTGNEHVTVNRLKLAICMRGVNGFLRPRRSGHVRSQMEAKDRAVPPTDVFPDPRQAFPSLRLLPPKPSKAKRNKGTKQTVFRRGLAPRMVCEDAHEDQDLSPDRSWAWYGSKVRTGEELNTLSDEWYLMGMVHGMILFLLLSSFM